MFACPFHFMENPSSAFQDFLWCFNVYLSLQDRNGRLIDYSKFSEIEDEIMAEFGGLTRTALVGNPVYHGFWKSPETKKVAYDRNTIFTVLAPQDQKSIQFFRDKKEEWRQRLDYEKLLITVYEIQAL